MLYDLLTDNKDSAQFYTNPHRFTTSVMMTVTDGKRVSSWAHDASLPVSANAFRNSFVADICGIYRTPRISKDVDEVMNDMLALSIPGTFLADSFLDLGKLPIWMQGLSDILGAFIGEVGLSILHVYKSTYPTSF